MSEPFDEADAVSRANQAFYTALEAGDLGAMAEVWAHDDDVVCAHPGRGPLRGWTAVEASWRAIFDHGGNPQIIVTGAVAAGRGDVAWVTATENLLASEHAGATTALNVFQRLDGRWRMVAHHAGPLLG